MKGQPATLSAAIEASASRGLGRLVFHSDNDSVALTTQDVAREATKRARSLRSLGVRRGSRVGVLGPNSPEWALWSAAIWKVGACLVPISYRLLGSPEAFAAHAASLARHAECRLVLADPDFLDAVPSDLGVAWDTVGAGRLRRGTGGPAPDDVAVIQFTSGSTSAPKGVMLSHRSVLASLRRSSAFLDLEPGRDRLVGWLPFFHDYGLFGFMTRALALGFESHVLRTEDFAQNPARWWQLIAAVEGTWTAGPPSAWAIALRTATADSVRATLRTLRGAVMAAETINVDTVDALLLRGREFGLRPGVVSGGYGLAEATLGVTGMPAGSGLRIDEIDAETFEASGKAVAAARGRIKRVASCGRPIAGVELRIVGPAGLLPERHVGEIYLRGPGVMNGYLGPDASDPFVEGWLPTGDLGYMSGGELFVTGRSKDLIIVLGRNYAPEELEWAAATVPGVRKGRCLAFAEPGDSGETAVVLVETSQTDQPDALMSLVRAAILKHVGGIPLRVVVLPNGSIKKTTSGKLRRSAMREAYRNGEVTPISP